MSRPEVVKSNSQMVQKEMITRNYDRITSGTAKVSSTFVPGNLNELLMCFDIANNLPEINAIQNAMRKKSGEMIAEAETMLLDRGVVSDGEWVAMAAGIPPNQKASTNLLKLHVIGSDSKGIPGTAV